MTGLYFSLFMSLLALVVAAAWSVRCCSQEKGTEAYIVVAFAVAVSIGVLANMLFPGGTAEHGARNATFLWMPALLPGMHAWLTKVGPSLILAVVCFGVQPAEPSASTMRLTAENQGFVAEQAVAAHPDAVFLTFANWPSLFLNVPPEYDFQSIVNLVMVGDYDAGVETLRMVEEEAEFVIVDGFFDVSLEYENPRNTLHRLDEALRDRFDVDEVIVPPHPLSAPTAWGSWGRTAHDVRVYRRKRREP